MLNCVRIKKSFRVDPRFNPHRSASKKRGFTLIEMLVVIAIIGILSGIILVALGGMRARARDARIIAEMGQLRNAAPLYYHMQTPNTYIGMDCNVAVPNIKALCADIALQGGKKPSDDTAGLDIIISDQAYCAEVKLNSGKYWCVDNAGISRQYNSNPDCDAGTSVYTCE